MFRTSLLRKNVELSSSCAFLNGMILEQSFFEKNQTLNKKFCNLSNFWINFFYNALDFDSSSVRRVSFWIKLFYSVSDFESEISQLVGFCIKLLWFSTWKTNSIPPHTRLTFFSSIPPWTITAEKSLHCSKNDFCTPFYKVFHLLFRCIVPTFSLFDFFICKD